MIKLDMENINRKAKMDVMNEVLKLRLSTLLKDEFQKACETNGTQAASVIRELMTECVRLTKQKGNR